MVTTEHSPAGRRGDAVVEVGAAVVSGVVLDSGAGGAVVSGVVLDSGAGGAVVDFGAAVVLDSGAGGAVVDFGAGGRGGAVTTIGSPPLTTRDLPTSLAETPLGAASPITREEQYQTPSMGSQSTRGKVQVALYSSVTS